MATVCAQLYQDIPYRADALSYMYDMQLNLQNAVAEKQHIEKDSWNKDNMYINSNKIAYHLSCFITEYWEFVEAKEKYIEMVNHSENFSDEELNKQLLELKYEIIDQYHFLMNMLIFGRIPTSIFYNITLTDIFRNIKNYPSDFPSENENTAITALIAKLGEYLNKFPYKTWKIQRYTAEQLANPPDNLEEIVQEIIRLFFNFCIFWIADEKEFWSLYYTKNLENIERQNNKIKGYVK